MGSGSPVDRFERGDSQRVLLHSGDRFSMHLGGTKMYQDHRHQYYLSGMKRHVGDFVRRCLTSQQVKAEHQKPPGLLPPLEVAEWKWEHFTMDFVTHFPRTPQRHDAVWVIVDRLTK